MKTKTLLLGTLAAVAIVVAGCASAPSMPTAAELDAQAMAMHKASFRAQGIAKLDRIEQDLGQAERNLLRGLRRRDSSHGPPTPQQGQR